MDELKKILIDHETGTIDKYAAYDLINTLFKPEPNPLTPLLEGAKKSKKALRSLKLAAIDAGQFELAAKLRDLEREIFPDSEDEIYAKNINLALRMSGVNPDLRQSWIIGKTMEAYRKSKGKFSIDQASELIAKADKIFEV